MIPAVHNATHSHVGRPNSDACQEDTVDAVPYAEGNGFVLRWFVLPYYPDRCGRA